MSIYPAPNNSNIFNEIDYDTNNNDDDINDEDLDNYVKKNEPFVVVKFTDNTQQYTAFRNQDKSQIETNKNTIDLHSLKLTDVSYNSNNGFTSITKINTDELQLGGLKQTQAYTNSDKTKIYENEGNIILHNNRITALETVDETDLSDLNLKTQNISLNTNSNLTIIDGDIDLTGNFVKMRNAHYHNELLNETVGEVGAINNANNIFHIAGSYGVNIRAWNNNIDLISDNEINITGDLNINGLNYNSKINSIETSITDNENNITSHSSTLSSHSSTLSNHSSSLASHNTRITSLENTISQSGFLLISLPLDINTLLGADVGPVFPNSSGVQYIRDHEINLGQILYNAGYTSLFYSNGIWRNWSKWIVNLQFRVAHKNSNVFTFKSGIRFREQDTNAEHSISYDYIDMGIDGNSDDNSHQSVYRFNSSEYCFDTNSNSILYGTHYFNLKVAYNILTSSNDGKNIRGLLTMRRL